MAEIHDPVETGMPRSVRYGIAVVVILIVFAWLIPRRAGEPQAPSADGQPGSAATTGKESEKAISDRESESRLAAALAGLSPESVAISSDRVASVTDLSQWAGEAFGRGDAAAVTIDEAANAKWLKGEAATDAANTGFSLRDGHHLTLATLAGEMVTRLVQKTTDPLQQIDGLFEIVVRETMLVPDEADKQLPGTPFEFLLLGRSTAAGRAWTLATLLRQLRVDAVIIEPKSKPEAWVIGVITASGDVLLYDPRLGTCLPGAAGPAGFEKPATLTSLKQNPELLRELDLPNAPYALTAEDLASVNVKLITDSITSSLRMAKLQTMITGSLMEVFDGLGKSPLREQGLIDRVIAAGAKSGWTEADVSVWSYPEEQGKAFMDAGAEDSPAWRGIASVFRGPISLTQVRTQTKNESESATATTVQRSTDPLRKIRVIHLQGRPADAIRGYLPIRTAARGMIRARDPEMQAQLDEARPLNTKCADFATFWTAACQAQMNPKLAPKTLGDYIRDFPQGEMMPAVAELWATSLVLAGDKPEAVRLLESGERRTPRLDVLLKQWRTPEPPKTPEPKATDKPADPPAATPPPAAAPAAAPPATDDRPPAPPEAT